MVIALLSILTILLGILAGYGIYALILGFNNELVSLYLLSIGFLFLIKPIRVLPFPDGQPKTSQFSDLRQSQLSRKSRFENHVRTDNNQSLWETGDQSRAEVAHS